MPLRVFLCAALAATAAAASLAHADDQPVLDIPVLEIRDHRFVPDRLEIPANVKVKLMVRNLDGTAEEFESYDLNREKVVAGGGQIPLLVGPLSPGEYKFFGDFHQDTAKGVIVVR